MQARDEGDFYFRQLANGEDAIHEAFGERLEWDPRTYSRGTRWIFAKVSGGFADDPPTHEKTAIAVARTMKKVVTATAQAACELPRYQPPAADATGPWDED